MHAATPLRNGSIGSIEPRMLHDVVQAGRRIELIDVRTPAEFREVHIPFAHNVPLDRLDPQAVGSRLVESAPLYVVCRTGSRAAKACEQLAAAGIDVVSVSGGTQAWEQAGLPVNRGKRTISLERQVRIAAGSLVLVGVALGAVVHPALYGLAAVIGAGLVFAGITDTCGMGMLLARMPWNQVQSSETVIPRPVPCNSRS